MISKAPKRDPLGDHETGLEAARFHNQKYEKQGAIETHE
jgi:hypothetical protein